jgi:hypothetical protein
MPRTNPTETETVTAASPWAMHLELKPEDLRGKDLSTCRQPFIDAAVKFSVEQCGRDPEMAAAKWVRLLHGLKSPCTIVDPEIHVASLTGWAAEHNHFLDSIAGYLRLVHADGTETRVNLPVDEDGEPVNQHLFLVAVKRVGQAQAGSNEVQKFWSYTLVSVDSYIDPKSEGFLARLLARQKPDTMPFAFALDLGLNSDGQMLFETSQIYFKRANDPTAPGGRRIVDNRADGLIMPTNLLAIATACAQACGFPLDQNRINRRTNQERTQLRQATQVALAQGSVPPAPARPAAVPLVSTNGKAPAPAPAG